MSRSVGRRPIDSGVGHNFCCLQTLTEEVIQIGSRVGGQSSTSSAQLTDKRWWGISRLVLSVYTMMWPF